MTVSGPLTLTVPGTGSVSRTPAAQRDLMTLISLPPRHFYKKKHRKNHLLHAGKFFMIFLFCRLQDFFFIKKKSKTLSGTQSDSQMVWILIWPYILSGLIWVQNVCTHYQQATNFATNRQRIRNYTKITVCSFSYYTECSLFITLCLGL